MTIKIAICDDEEIIRIQLKNIISNYLSVRKVRFKIHSYTSGIDLLEASDQIDFSFIFLDIDLGEYNGVDIAKSIRTKQKKPVNIIFVTNYIEFQTKVLSIHTFDYLIKPVNNDRLYKVLDDLMFWYNKEGSKQKERIRFKTIDGIITIYIDELLYFEYNNRRIDIVTKNRTFSMYGKIKDIAKKMKKYDFALTHSAYIVNMKEINQYLKSENKIVMTDEKCIPISQLRAKYFRELYLNFIDKMWKEGIK